MDGNIISAAYCGTTYITTRPAWLIDYGMVLKLEGLELPNVYEVDFANNKSEKATRVLGGPDGVVIPNKFFLSDAPQIFAWLYLHAGEDDGYTKIQVTIPLSRRPDITDEQPTPEESSLIEQAIAALNTGVEDAEAWAVGERDGEPVSEGDPTYENSAKYWAEKAKTDAPVTSVNGKAGDIELNLDDIPDGETYVRATPNQLAQISQNADDIADIDKLIPAEASAGNQLADKYFVNNEIQTNSAHFRGVWPNWFAVPTDKNQYPADNKGIKTPSANDYIVVLDANGYPAGQTILSGTWRFSYAGSWEMNGRNGWKNEYQVNETALHTEQIAAINAKIPSQASASNQLADKNLVNTKLMAYRTAADQDAIDSSQDGKINALTNLLNNKQSKITASGILKGDGNGGVSAAVPGMDYLPTSALYAYRSANAQDAIDNAQNENINKNTAAINTMQPAATAADIGKALIVKTVADGKPTSYEYGEAGGGGSALTAGDGIDITEDVISNTQGIEYIVGTQSSSTASWTGNSKDEALKVGKIIAYYLPFAGSSLTNATLTLTMAGGAQTAAIPLRRAGTSTVTNQFAAGNVIILIYDGTYWRVSAYYDANDNTVPTGYCLSPAATAAKAATCSYGYRGDTNYFPCLFRFANTAADATLAINTYAPEAAPIYVNGARTSATNTFGAGVILFLYYNGAYYCYNDGRFPILVDGAVTSVQEYAAGLLADYRTAAAQDTIDAGKQAKITASGILKGDGAGGVSAAVAGTDYLAPSALEPYRTVADQDLIDSEQDERLDAVEQTTTATTIGPVALATFDVSAADMPLKGLTVNIEPAQSGSGDPSPDNVRPITGRTSCKLHHTGVSLIGGDAFVGNTFSKTANGYELSYNGSSIGNRASGYADIRGLPAGRYTIAMLNLSYPAGVEVNIRRSTAGSTVTMGVIINADSATGRRIYVIPENTTSLQLYIIPGTMPLNTSITMSDIVMVREGDITEPYKGNTYNITFPTEAGTVYGGTLDVTQGKMVVDRAINVIDGTQPLSNNGIQAYGGLQVGYTPIPVKAPADTASTQNLNLLSDKLSSSLAYPPDPFQFTGRATSSNIYINMPASVTEVEQARAWFAENNTQIVYKLATPIEITLSPTEIEMLLGENNIWANCGDVTVTYGAYLEIVKAYADKVGDSILSAIAPLETTYTASRTYTVGSFLFVGTKFYKVTAAISSGDTITPDTNVTQTTVAEQLMALAANA